MIERARRFDVREAALAAFAVAGAAAFAFGRAEPRAWLVLLAFPPAVAFRITSIPPRLSGALEKVGWIAIGLLAAAVFSWLASTEGQGQPAPPLPAAASYAAPVLSALFLTGRSVWPPWRALIPAVLITTVLGASQARSARSMGVAVGVVSLTGLVVLLGDEGYGAASTRLRRLMRVAGFAVLAAAIAMAISRLLPWAQPYVVQAAARAAFPEASSGFSPEASLGEAEELTLSPEVVLRAWSDRPLKLRAWVATRFDGARWHATPGPVRSVPGSAWAPPGALAAWFDEVPGQTFLVDSPESSAQTAVQPERTRILLILSVPGSIPAPAGVVALRAPAGRVAVDAAGLLGPALPAGTLYALVSGTAETGDAPGSDTLALPADIDSRLVALAERLAAGALTKGERLERTLTYLQRELRYSLRVGRFRSRQPVAEFVFEKKRGWCQYFASAAAVLLRLEGVPTRYVSGFQLRKRLLRGGHYVVRQADAHAWIEAWLPDRGWVEADPTPASGYDEAHGGPGGGWLDGAWEWLRGLGGRLRAVDWRAVPRVLWAEAVALAPRGPMQALLLPAVVFLAIVSAPRVRRWIQAFLRRRAALSSQTDADELAPLLARLDHAWSRYGVPRPPSRAPLEHLQQLTPDRVPRTLLDASRAVVEAYYRSHFAGCPLRPGEVEAVDSALRSLP